MHAQNCIDHTANPQLAIFITLGIGYWIGAKRFGSFSLGAVTGTLLAGVIIGQIGIEIGDNVAIRMTGPVTRVAEGTLHPELFTTKV